jgi:hypothetical protein
MITLSSYPTIVAMWPPSYKLVYKPREYYFDISTINHSYWSYWHQLSYLGGTTLLHISNIQSVPRKNPGTRMASIRLSHGVWLRSSWAAGHRKPHGLWINVDGLITWKRGRETWHKTSWSRWNVLKYRCLHGLNIIYQELGLPKMNSDIY